MIPNIYRQYECPKGRQDGRTPAVNTPDSNASVQGRYCKNGCGFYKNNTCEIFKR